MQHNKHLTFLGEDDQFRIVKSFISDAGAHAYINIDCYKAADFEHFITIAPYRRPILLPMREQNNYMQALLKNRTQAHRIGAQDANIQSGQLKPFMNFEIRPGFRDNKN